MAVMNVSSVWAAGTSTLSFAKATTVLNGTSKATYYFDANGNKLESQTGAYFTVYLNGDRTSKSSTTYLGTNSTSDTFTFTTTEDNATLAINACSTSGSTDRTMEFDSKPTSATTGDGITVSGTSMSNYSTKLSGKGTYTFHFSGNVQITKITVTEEAKTGYSFEMSDNTYAGYFTFSPDSVETLDNTEITISYTGDDFSLTPVPFAASADNFTLNEENKTATFDVSRLTMTPKTYTATVAAGSYTGTFELSKTADIGYADEFTLTYSGDDYTMTAQTFSVANKTAEMSITDGVITITPNSGWFKENISTISVEPKTSGNTTTYNFATTGTEKYYLIDSTDVNKSNTTAYSEYAEGCNVVLDADGAKLNDDSKLAAAKLVVPYSASYGKVTVSGSVTPTLNVGSKWALVNIGNCIYVSTDASSNMVITGKNDTSYSENAGAIEVGKEITYSVTLDFDNKTVSGTITNGTTEKAFNNIDFVAGSTSMSNIVFITNTSGAASDSSSKARSLTIPSVTIVKEPAAATQFTFEKIVRGGNTNTTVYVIGKISNVTDFQQVGFGAGKTEDGAAKSARDDRWLDTTKVASAVVDESESVNESAVDGTYYAAFKVEDVSGDIYVVPFTVDNDGNTVYGAAVKAE